MRCANDQAGGGALRCPGCGTLTHSACSLELEAAGVYLTLWCALAHGVSGVELGACAPRRSRRLAEDNRVLVMANAVSWTYVGLLGGASAFASLAILLHDA